MWCRYRKHQLDEHAGWSQEEPGQKGALGNCHLCCFRFSFVQSSVMWCSCWKHASTLARWAMLKCLLLFLFRFELQFQWSLIIYSSVLANGLPAIYDSILLIVWIIYLICIVKYSRSVSTCKLLVRDEVRRAYLLNGPNRAPGHVFPRTLDGKIWRSFQQNWFDLIAWNIVWKRMLHFVVCYLF